MRGFILQKLRRGKPAVVTTIPPTQDLQAGSRPDLPRGSPIAQKQCDLFGKLSAEVRLLIYEAALADADRLLHFLHATPTRGRPKKLGHWRCDGLDSPYLTWQHPCFGLWIEPGVQYTRNASHTNSDLMSLLLTCRLIYNEAVEVLYTANYFSFRGATGLPAFRELVAPTSWHMLRRVHISTNFSTPMNGSMKKRGSFPKENYLDWEDGCRDLVSLTGLRLLRIEINVWDYLEFHDPAEGTVDEQALLFILNALKPVRAQTFQVGLNFKLPRPIVQVLGHVPFEIVRHGKTYDKETFPI